MMNMRRRTLLKRMKMRVLRKIMKVKIKIKRRKEMMM